MIPALAAAGKNTKSAADATYKRNAIWNASPLASALDGAFFT